VERNGRVWLEPVRTETRGQRLVTTLRGSFRKHTRLTTDELMALTRSEEG
jgi:hypothetical protein